MRPLFVSLALVLSATASAVPMEFSHQGRLFDGAGVPLDGGHDLDFTVYDAPAGGTALWTESHAGASFDAGYFSVQLGAATPLDSSIFEGDDLYLTMAIDGGAEVPERIRLASVPFAVRAGVADGLSAPIDFSQIVNTPETVGGLDCAAGETAEWDGSNWMCATNNPAHVHDAADIDTGTLTVARLPIGTGADSVAVGDHSHTAADVGALPASTTAADIGGLPDTTTAADIGGLPDTTTAADIGGLPDTTTAADIGAMPDSGGTFSGLLEAPDVYVTGDVTVDGDLEVAGFDLMTHLRMNAARGICYAALETNGNASVIMMPFVRGDGTPEQQCTSNINGGWHACGVAKSNHNTQNCNVFPNESYGGGYTSFVRESTFAPAMGSTYSGCNETNTMICCSTNCTAGW